MDGCLRSTMPDIMFKLRISCLQIFEALAYAVMITHQWMSLSEHTYVLRPSLGRQGRQSTDVCFFSQGHVRSNVGLQMSLIITELSTLCLHPRVKTKIVKCFAKHAFIYRNGVH